MAVLVDCKESLSHVYAHTGVELLNAHGKEGSQLMLPLLEGYLDKKRRVAVDEETYDRVRTGAVVFLGTLARHLNPSDPKVRGAGFTPCPNTPTKSGCRTRLHVARCQVLT